MTSLLLGPLGFSAAAFFLPCCVAFALEVPPLRGRINDSAGLLSQEQSSQLEAKLAQFENATGHQVAVLTIATLEGDSLEDFSIRVAEAWKIGHKGNNNGVMLIVAHDDRKIRIEVGYGLEGVLPDAVAYRIIQEVIIPRFRDRDFAGGIESGVSAIVQAIRGEPISAVSRTPTRSADSHLSTILLLLTGTALFGSVVGFAQPSLVRAAVSGAFVSSILGLPGLSVVGTAIWLIAICIGAVASMLAVQFSRRAWGRSWNVRPSQHSDYSPRDTFRTGYGGGGSGGHGASGSAESGGTGGFGGGGASGGW